MPDYKELWQHRTIWQERSAKDFASYESYKRAGILYVFPPFITARMGQKIGRRPQTQLCGDALYLTLFRATEQAIHALIEAQQSCEAMYLDQCEAEETAAESE